MDLRLSWSLTSCFPPQSAIKPLQWISIGVWATFKRQILQNNTTYQWKKIIIDYWTGLRTLLPRFPSIILLFFFGSQQCAGLVVGCMMISVCYWGNILTTIHLLSHLTAWDLLNLHVCRLCEEMAYPEEIHWQHPNSTVKGPTHLLVKNRVPTVTKI